MVSFLCVVLLALLVPGSSQEEDSCYQRYGTNKARCERAARRGQCAWFPHESGEGGECGLRELHHEEHEEHEEHEDHDEHEEHEERNDYDERHGSNEEDEHDDRESSSGDMWEEEDADGCYERFRENRTACESTHGRCQWYVSRGTCGLPEDEGDDCYRRFGHDKNRCEEASPECQWDEDRCGDCQWDDDRCVTRTEEDRDGCYERFRENRTACESTQGRCQWYSNYGECGLPEEKEEDGCFRRFGTDRAKCQEAGEACHWDDDRCVMRREEEDRDGCYERFRENRTACESTQDRCQWYASRGACGLSALDVAGAKDEGDGCYKRFGRDQAKCERAKKCQWDDDKCVMRVTKEGDGGDSCYEMYGENRTACESTQSRCQWYASGDGERGKCSMLKSEEKIGGEEDRDFCSVKFKENRTACEASHSCQWRSSLVGNTGSCMPKAEEMNVKGDFCYTRYKENKTACEGARGKCQWYAGRQGKSGQCGKLELEDVDGCRKGEGKRECTTPVTRGVLNLALETTLTQLESWDILSIVEESADIISSTIRSTYGFSSVRMLNVSIARRLQAGIVTRVRVEFEGRGTRSVTVQQDAAASNIQTALQSHLESNYEQEGATWRVHSPSLEFQEAETPSQTSRTDGTESNEADNTAVFIGVAAGGLLCVMLVVATVFLGCRKKKANNIEASLFNVAEAQQIPEKSNDCQNDQVVVNFDCSDVSTETPTTNEKSEVSSINNDKTNLVL